MPKTYEYTFETEISFKGRITVEAVSHEHAVELIEEEMEIQNSPLLLTQPGECWEGAVQTVDYIPA